MLPGTPFFMLVRPNTIQQVLRKVHDMQTAITATQGKAVLGGRNPFEIVPYEQAIQALRECLTFDDTKYWDNYADAAKAWGKIHRNEEVVRLSKAVKLRAAARMAELAIKIRGAPGRRNVPGQRGASPGPHSLLRDNGMSTTAAAAAIKLVTRPGLLDSSCAKRNPPALTSVAQDGTAASPWGKVSARFSHLHTMLTLVGPKEAAKSAVTSARDLDRVRRHAQEMSDWLDTFMAALPKPARK